MFELAWREYFHHAWTRLGDGILSALRPPPGRGYRAQLPDDLISASTGVKVIDHAVRTLHDSGYARPARHGWGGDQANEWSWLKRNRLRYLSLLCRFGELRLLKQ